MRVDLARVGDLIREIAAEELVPKFKMLDPGEIDEKAPNDLVTSVDLAMEARLEKALSDVVPGARVVGEEAVAADRHRLDWLRQDEAVWVVDPLDGTSNFAAGLPLFAVIVALIRQGEVVAGWIYDPPGDRLAAGEVGGGAWIASERLAVRRPDDLRQMNGSIYGRPYRTSEAYRRIWGRGRGSFGNVFNARCVGQEHLARLVGRMHFGLYTRLNPWDHAAGCLLHHEAGGHVALLDGTPYRPGDLPTEGALLTPDADIWEDFRRCLLEPVRAEKAL